METTDEFMARFRATGLDMLTGMQRREKHGYADRRWVWGSSVTRSFSLPYLGYQSIPRDDVWPGPDLTRYQSLGRIFRSSPGPVVYDMDWSNGDLRVVRHLGDGVEIDVPNPEWRVFDPVTLDFNTFPSDQPEFGALDTSELEHLASGHRDVTVIGANRIGRSMYSASMAAALATAAMTGLSAAMEPLVEWQSAPTPQPVQYKTWNKNEPVRFGNNKAWKMDRSIKKKLAKASRKRNRK